MPLSALHTITPPAATLTTAALTATIFTTTARKLRHRRSARQHATSHHNADLTPMVTVGTHGGRCAFTSSSKWNQFLTYVIYYDRIHGVTISYDGVGATDLHTLLMLSL